MPDFTLTDLENMRIIIENDIESSGCGDILDFYDIELLYFYSQRAALHQKIVKAISLKEEEY